MKEEPTSNALPLEDAEQGLQSLEVFALDSSLTTMQQVSAENIRKYPSFPVFVAKSWLYQVLNDVLDLQRRLDMRSHSRASLICTFAGMDAGRFEMTPRPFNLHGTLSSMLGSVKVATDSKNLSLVVELDPRIDALQSDLSEDGLYVVGDPIRLGQVLTNLTSNAIKFSPSGEIKVSPGRRLGRVPSLKQYPGRSSLSSYLLSSHKWRVHRPDYP